MVKELQSSPNPNATNKNFSASNTLIIPVRKINNNSDTTHYFNLSNSTNMLAYSQSRTNKKRKETTTWSGPLPLIANQNPVR